RRRPLMPQSALEFGALAAGQRREPGLPFPARRGAAAADLAPALQDVVRDRERLERNTEVLLGALEFFGAQRLAMGLVGAGLGRRAVADRGLAGDQRWLVGFFGAGDRRGDRLLILAVDQLGLPAGRLESFHLVDRV